MKKIALLLASAAAAGAQSYDLVVYGGTAGGAITAVSGARMGLKTALIEPRQHIGGMVSGFRAPMWASGK
jgi:glycerol-3-phosphate dehydrogenase